MAILTSTQTFLGKTASVLGIIQGLLWFAMSLICIIVYSVNETPTTDSTIWNDFKLQVYKFYLDKNGDFVPEGTLITPTAFIVFIGIYVVLTTMWVVISFFQISVLASRSLNIPIIFKDWALLTFLVALVDFIFVVLLGVDYREHCLDKYGEKICVNTIIPVLVIAARGFVLWIVNVLLAWRLIKEARILRQDGDYEGTFGGIIPLFNPTGVIPRAAVTNDTSLYSQQSHNITYRDPWSVNLRTAMDARTPPVTPYYPSTPSGTPRTPYQKGDRFSFPAPVKRYSTYK